MAKEILILSPVCGDVIELKNVKDEVFAQEMVGKGFAVRPHNHETKVMSPIEKKGNVKMAFEGGHAYGIKFKDIELLVHIGIETVGLKGEGFNQKTFTGDKVKKDTVLTEMDLKIISKKAKATDVIVLVTNDTIGTWKVERVAGKTVEPGDVLFKLVK